MTLDAERFDQRAYFCKGRLQQSKCGKLATDVNGNAAHVQARKLRSAIIAGKSSAVGNTEFVFRFPRRNLFMRARIDIGIDAIGDWRDLTHRESNFAKQDRKSTRLNSSP